MKKIIFSQNLKKLRIQNGMSQELVAERLGVERSTIAKWEAGSYPSIDNMVNIAEMFAITLDELVCGDIGKKNLTEISEDLKKQIIDTVRQAVSGHIYELDTYQKYLQRNTREEFPAEYYGYVACEEVEKGNYGEAISLYEEALFRGELDVIFELARLSLECFEMETAQIDNEYEYYESYIDYAKKIGSYGKIIEDYLFGM